MLLKVHSGVFNPDGGDLEPNGQELWCGGDEELSAAVLTTVIKELELGTWYTLDDFEKLLSNWKSGEAPLPNTIKITQPGVRKPWTTAIEIDEQSAALMICQSVVKHARRLQSPSQIWVRVE